MFASLLGEASRARAAGAKPLQPERARGAELHPTLRAFSFFAFGRSREAVTERIGRDARVRENLDTCCSVTRLTFHRSHEFEFGEKPRRRGEKSLLLLLCVGEFLRSQ